METHSSSPFCPERCFSLLPITYAITYDYLPLWHQWKGVIDALYPFNPHLSIFFFKLTIKECWKILLWEHSIKHFKNNFERTLCKESMICMIIPLYWENSLWRSEKNIRIRQKISSLDGQIIVTNIQEGCSIVSCEGISMLGIKP